MVKVTIPKTEYEQLKRQAAVYRKFAAKFFESVIKTPIEEVVEDFRKTGLYTEEFLRDLESGLRKSSYTQEKRRARDEQGSVKAKKYGNKAFKKRS